MEEARIHKLCSDPPGPDRNPNREWVEVEVGSRGIQGYALKHLVNPGTPHEREATYFRFGKGLPELRAGQRVRVHSGGGDPHWDASDTNLLHAYREPPGHHGRFWLNNEGDAIRLINPKGDEVDRKAVGPGKCDSAGGGGVVVPVKPPRAFGGKV
jgi:hypothetical protein